MTGCAELACVLLAAGEGRRFGGNKLESRISPHADESEEAMLGVHAARTLATFGFAKLVAVCNAANTALNHELASLGFELLINPDPSLGQSKSLAMGIGQVAKLDISGALIALADMPFITAAHITRLAEAFDGARAVCSFDGAMQKPPAILPRSMFADVQMLSGDRGARAMLADAVAIFASRATLADIDRPEDIAR